MTTLDDVRKTIEALIGNLTPAKAQEIAKSVSDPGAAKEQVAKLAADLLEWSQRSRDRLREIDLSRGLVADEVDGRGHAGRSGRGEEAGP